MRIVFDARSYFMRTGIARYTRGLAHALAASPGRHEWLFLISDHHQPSEIALGSSAVEVRQSHAPWLGGAFEREALARESSEWSADTFHSVFPPHALATVRTITTVFDFSPLSHPDLHQELVRSAFLNAWTSAQADAHAFIAVSSATATEVGARAAAQAIGRLRDPSTLDALMEAGRVPGQHVHVLRSVADALGALGRAAAPALPLLKELAKQPRVRWAAEAAMKKIS